MIQYQPRRALIVLGMHRCGTSAISGVFHLLGFHLGSQLISGLEENPKGFFENELINQFNNKLLSSLKSNWHSTYLLQNKWYDDASLDIFRIELNQIINEQFGMEDPILIKDPRLSILWPFYADILKNLEIHPCFIVCFRNPSEVAASLRKRNLFTDEKSILIWMDHILKAELFTRRYLRYFLLFGDLIDDLFNQVRGIIRKLNFDIRIQPKDVIKVNQFIEDQLKHYNLQEIEEYHRFIPEVQMTYNELLELKNEKPDSQSWDRFDTIATSFYKKLSFFYGLDGRNYFLTAGDL